VQKNVILPEQPEVTVMSAAGQQVPSELQGAQAMPELKELPELKEHSAAECFSPLRLIAFREG
jgi:hypothetical protein